MKRFQLLLNRHKNQRCVLIANGPSLNKMDLSFLKKETTIGLNKIYLGFKKFSFYPRYYVAINPTVIKQSVDVINALNCVKFLGERADLSAFRENALTYFINTKNPPERFCKDISSGVHEGWTVTYAALQIAYYLGFKEVIIIGMDHHFVYNGQPNEGNVLQGDDPNHFSSAYFGHGQAWDNPDIEHSEESYLLAKDIFEQDGRQIIDATVNGRCQIFEKADYKKIFKIS